MVLTRERLDPTLLVRGPVLWRHIQQRNELVTIPFQHLLLPRLFLLLLFLPQESLLEEEPRGCDVHAVCATTQTRDGEKRSLGARASRVLHNQLRRRIL